MIGLFIEFCIYQLRFEGYHFKLRWISTFVGGCPSQVFHTLPQASLLSPSSPLNPHSRGSLPQEHVLQTSVLWYCYPSTAYCIGSQLRWVGRPGLWGDSSLLESIWRSRAVQVNDKPLASLDLARARGLNKRGISRSMIFGIRQGRIESLLAPWRRGLPWIRLRLCCWNTRTARMIGPPTPCAHPETEESNRRWARRYLLPKAWPRCSTIDC